MRCIAGRDPCAQKKMASTTHGIGPVPLISRKPIPLEKYAQREPTIYFTKKIIVKKTFDLCVCVKSRTKIFATTTVAINE